MCNITRFSWNKGSPESSYWKRHHIFPGKSSFWAMSNWDLFDEVTELQGWRKKPGRHTGKNIKKGEFGFASNLKCKSSETVTAWTILVNKQSKTKQHA